MEQAPFTLNNGGARSIGQLCQEDLKAALGSVSATQTQTLS